MSTKKNFIILSLENTLQKSQKGKMITTGKN